MSFPNLLNFYVILKICKILKKFIILCLRFNFIILCLKFFGCFIVKKKFLIWTFKSNFLQYLFIYIYIFHFLRKYLLKNKINSFNFNFIDNYF